MGADGPRDEAVHGKKCLSRRTLLKGGLALGAGGTAGVAGLSSSAGASIDRALALAPSTLPTLSDIRHVVFLMHERPGIRAGRFRRRRPRPSWPDPEGRLGDGSRPTGSGTRHASRVRTSRGEGA